MDATAIGDAGDREVDDRAKGALVVEGRRQLARGLVEQARPPIFYKRRDLVSRELSLWSGDDLAKAGERLADAVAAARKSPALAEALVGDVLLTLGRVARSRARR